MSNNVFTFQVDTAPMGDSLMHISGAVNSATGAVLESAAAIVAAEQEGSKAVSRNITAGFFSLIRSQVEQKKAAAKSSVDAKQAQLVVEKNACANTEAQFIADFNRIKNRYNKLFTNLNKALKQRIQEIDKPAFRMVEDDYRFSIRKRMFLVGGSAVSGIETSNANAALRSSQTKGQVVRLLGSIKNYLAKTQKLKLEIASILGTDRTDSPQEICLPFLVAETDSMIGDARSWMLRTPQGMQDFSFSGELESGIDAIDLGTTTWAEAEKDFRDRVAQHFGTRLQDTPLNRRVAQTIQDLFEASAWQVMKGIPS